MSKSNTKTIARNRKARHNFEITDTLEAGLALAGSEVKSIRAGKVSIAEAYVKVVEGEAWIVGMHISHYGPAGDFGHEEDRPRRLLLHRRELNRLAAAVDRKGMTLVPLELYFRGAFAKLRIGLARGKRQYDKRESIREREDKRRARAAVREMRRHGG
jgi:SsrA-binding protein